MNSRNILSKFVSLFLVLSFSAVSFAETTLEKFEEPNFEYTEEEKAILADTPAPTGYSFLIGSAILAGGVALVVYALKHGAATVAPGAGALPGPVAPRRNPMRAVRLKNQ